MSITYVFNDKPLFQPKTYNPEREGGDAGAQRSPARPTVNAATGSSARRAPGQPPEDTYLAAFWEAADAASFKAQSDLLAAETERHERKNTH